MEWWSLGISIVSVLITGAATINAWQSRQSARAADARAERSASAAEQSAKAAQSYARISQELFEAGKIQLQVERDYTDTDRRSLVNSSNSGYLVNKGTHNAYDVNWSGSDHVVSPIEEIPVMAPGVRVPLYLVLGYGSFDTRFKINYRESDDGPVKTVELVF